MSVIETANHRPPPRELYYPPARGRYAPRQSVESLYEVRTSVVSGRPNCTEFVQLIRDELTIRKYQRNTIKDYCNNLRNFLRWFGRAPHQVQRADVKAFLLYLADADRSASTLSCYLATIRTAFDKMCLRNVTVGIVTPRKSHSLPVVLSRKEVQRILESTPSLQEKLILGLMYACGLRVSEVARLRYRDLDIDRRVIMVRRGKGLRDRPVILPETFRPLLKSLSSHAMGETFLFASRMKPGKYISPRTIQRIMQRAVAIAGIKKKATPHSLRHSFATHTFEDGCDIRNIQKLLGHVHLETTTIYVKVARPTDPLKIRSPLDRMNELSSPSSNAVSSPVETNSQTSFRLSFHFQCNTEDVTTRVGSNSTPGSTKVTIGIRKAACPNEKPLFLTGIKAEKVREGWFNLSIPPLENWESTLSKLSPANRAKIESPKFYALLQSEIPKRLSQL